MEHPWKNIFFYKGNNLDASAEFFAKYEEWKYALSENENVLNTMRENIDKYECADDGRWEYYKKVINPYELVYTQGKYSNFPESVCLLKPLSRSYFKMIEMMALSDFFKTMKDDRIRSAHVCEGPGGFIEALIEESSKCKKTLVQATAMTLKPNQTNVPGWKRAAGFLQKHKNVKIIYGEDNTGDIMKIENQKAFIDSCVTKVNIFTSDGGFDFSIDYSAQERFIFPLLLTSTRIGFEVLKEGGVFIIKFFDTYYDGMRDLVYFLSCFFKSWTMYKPATSRPCNPEQYFIGRGFKGCPAEISAILHNWCVHLERGFTPSRICTGRTLEFDEQIQEINRKSVALQAYYLKQIFEIIEHTDDTVIKTILKDYETVSYEWCKKFNVPVYPARARLIEASQSDRLASSRL